MWMLSCMECRILSYMVLEFIKLEYEPYICYVDALMHGMQDTFLHGTRVYKTRVPYSKSLIFLRVCLRFAYFVETKNFLLKVL